MEVVLSPLTDIPKEVCVVTSASSMKLAEDTAAVFGGAEIVVHPGKALFNQDWLLNHIQPGRLLVAAGVVPVRFGYGASFMPLPPDYASHEEGVVDTSWIDGDLWYPFLEDIKDAYEKAGRRVLWYHQLGAAMHDVLADFPMLTGFHIDLYNSPLEVRARDRVLLPGVCDFLVSKTLSFDGRTFTVEARYVREKDAFHEI